MSGWDGIDWLVFGLLGLSVVVAPLALWGLVALTGLVARIERRWPWLVSDDDADEHEALGIGAVTHDAATVEHRAGGQ